MHYKEYLVSLINKHDIDPVTIMTTDDVTRLLERMDIPVPAIKGTDQLQNYHDRLVRVSLYESL